MERITPFLWFDDQAEEAMNFYISIFSDSKVIRINRHKQDENDAEGIIMSVMFQLRGQEFIALNGGPYFTFSEAISFFVNCDTQEEIDDLWEKLSEGGEKQRCGWLKDKFGVSWQIVPSILVDMLNDTDTEKAKRVTIAMLKMDKLNIDDLEKAYNG